MDGYHVEKVHPNLKDEDIVDWHSTDYCIERIRSAGKNQPFFLACGLYKPHLAFVAPRKYYEAFPLETIELPPHREDDLDDIPPAGIKMANPKGDHAKFLESGRWKAAIQSYLATCAYTDMNVGRLLDALEASSTSAVTITGANADAGGRAMNAHLEAFAAARPHVHYTPSLGQLRYLSLARLSAAVVGNSSSGLIEVPALGVPTVNIGERQRNRLRAPSVIDCANTQAAIGAAIHQAMGADMRAVAARRVNPYGAPGAACSIVKILAEVQLEGILLKRFCDRG